MPKRVLQALDELSRQLGLAVVTPEYEILLVLLLEGALGTEELCSRSSLSRSGFFQALDRLKHWQLIACDAPAEDRRSKTYRLHPRTEQTMIARFRQFRRRGALADLAMSRRDGAGNAGTAPDSQCLGPEWDRQRVAHLTCEYQIIVYLHATPGATSGEIAGAIAASPTKFHAALARLVADGLVAREADGCDRRRRRHHLSELAWRAEEQVRRAVFAWLDEVAAEADEDGDEEASSLPPSAHGHGLSLRLRGIG